MSFGRQLQGNFNNPQQAPAQKVGAQQACSKGPQSTSSGTIPPSPQSCQPHTPQMQPPTPQQPGTPQQAMCPTGDANKEASLMPVPSPQQIQYLNAFEGQELTIQKQPNNTSSLRDGEIMSP